MSDSLENTEIVGEIDLPKAVEQNDSEITSGSGEAPKKRGRPAGKVSSKAGEAVVEYVAVRVDTKVRAWPHRRGAEVFGVGEFPVFFDGKGVARDIDQENLEHFLSVPGYIGLTADDLSSL